ncbi:isoeugenol synthase 1-like [Magnolia sinica]|uniref:isoeugenol synthase 1-like n=1 Tax=Magnolia sinica TaxID=86752 RepID=UPI002658E9AD|nr:isoeugenol synthase 1-like [Magnolia sinica]
MGVKVFQGYLDEHDKLVSVIQEVDIVISALAIPQHEEQLKIIDAIKEAGNIKRFVPSEFGCETDRASALPPFQAVLDKRKKVRGATEASGIPYTFIYANCFGAYFVDVLLHPLEKRDVLVYGTGETKGIYKHSQ